MRASPPRLEAIIAANPFTAFRQEAIRVSWSSISCAPAASCGPEREAIEKTALYSEEDEAGQRLLYIKFLKGMGGRSLKCHKLGHRAELEYGEACGDGGLGIGQATVPECDPFMSIFQVRPRSSQALPAALAALLPKALAAQGARVALSGHAASRRWSGEAEIGGDHPIVPCNSSGFRCCRCAGGASGSGAWRPGSTFSSNAGITKDGLLLRMKDEDLAKRPEDQSGELFPALARGAEDMMKQPLGPDYRHYLCRRRHRKPRTGELRGLESRHDRAHQGDGRRGRQPQRHRQHASRQASSPRPMTDVLQRVRKRQRFDQNPRRTAGQGADDRRRGRLSGQRARPAYVTGQTLHVNGGMAMI